MLAYLPNKSLCLSIYLAQPTTWRSVIWQRSCGHLTDLSRDNRLLRFGIKSSTFKISLFSSPILSSPLLSFPAPPAIATGHLYLFRGFVGKCCIKYKQSSQSPNKATDYPLHVFHLLVWFEIHKINRSTMMMLASHLSTLVALKEHTWSGQRARFTQ